jgi:drug/metabolite transporter (DMT)-like permease
MARSTTPPTVSAATPESKGTVVAAWILCCVVWGTTWFAIRRCIGPGGYPTVLACALRFGVAALLLGAVWAVGWARPGPRTRRQVWALFAAGGLGAIGYGLVYLAERSISGGVAAVIFGTFPLVTALLATLGGVEKVSRASLVGSLLALAGMVLVFADRLDVSRAQALGVVLTLGSVFVSSLYTMILKRTAGDVHPLAMTGIFLGTGAGVLGLYAAIVEREAMPWPPPFAPTVALAYLALIGSVLVFACYFYLLKHVRLMTVALLVVVEPVIALIVDAIWERDVVLVARSYLGIAVTFGGIVVSTFIGRRRN